jgi:hypothetical protein
MPATAKKILSSACSELHAELAFIWIGFVVSTLLTVYLVSLGLKAGRSVSRLFFVSVPFRRLPAPRFDDRWSVMRC